MTIQYDSSIVKLDKDGNSLLSLTLEKGEKLVNGQTYKQELARLAAVNGPSVFAQGSMVEHNDPEKPAAAAKLDSTQTNTIREGDDENATGEQPVETEPSHIATVTEDGNSTEIVTPDEDLLNRETPGAADATAQDGPPAKDASKEDWYEYAKTKGFDGEYETTTKKSFIEQYGK